MSERAGDPGIGTEVVDEAVLERAVRHVRERGIRLPTFAELANPHALPAAGIKGLGEVDPDAPDPRNLFRVHWFNGPDRRERVEVPAHVVLPSSLTGVEAPIVVLLGDRFPLIGAHKVLAAYGCLVPRLVTGRFDPTEQRAVWPSTGNYCRGGVAISRILGCRGVAVLPEGMSAERFEWLADWVLDPADIVRTPGTESNVREIYEACDELADDPGNVIFNQFREFGNHLAHWRCTGRALEVVLEHLRTDRPSLEAFAFCAASGSAGTLGAGDLLREREGSRIAVAEALECPTLLYNGYGSHDIQGIGDKHVPLIHRVGTTDVVTAVSDRATDGLFALLQSGAGRTYLRERRGIPADAVEAVAGFGLSGLCNVLASIKLARHFDLGPDRAILTVATDSAALYGSELERIRAESGEEVDEVRAAEIWGEHVLGQGTDHLRELDRTERDRIFNLGYFTWVEQRGVDRETFDARRDDAFWEELHELPSTWDDRIRAFNERVAE